MDKKETLPEFEKAKSGLAISLALIALGAWMYFFPGLLGSPGITVIVSLLLAMTGITILHGELLLMHHGSRSYKTENIGVGLFFVAVWALLYYKWPYWFVNIFSFLFLLIGLYGIARGLIDSAALLLKPSEKGSRVLKTAAFIVLVGALVLTGWKLVETVQKRPLKAPQNTGFKEI